MTLLTPAEITAQAQTLPPGWQVEGRTLRWEGHFKDFVAAIAFVNTLVDPAEAAGHHPDITISYNRVTLILTTHDKGGLTHKDFDLAQAIAALP